MYFELHVQDLESTKLYALMIMNVPAIRVSIFLDGVKVLAVHDNSDEIKGIITVHDNLRVYF